MSIGDLHKMPFTKARLARKTSLLKAGGWTLGQADEQLMDKPSIAFYVHDQQTSWTWMCTVPKDIFFDVTKGLPSYDVCSAAAGVTQLVKQAGADQSDHDWEEKLAYLLMAYIVKTQTFKSAGLGHTAPHFLIICYGGGERVRPAAMGGSDQYVLPVAQVLEAFAHMMRRDALLHPEWIQA